MLRSLVLLILFAPAVAFAHGDIVPFIVGGTDNGSGFPLGGKINAALGDDVTGLVEAPGTRVFGIDLDEFSGFNNRTMAPGSPAFNNETYSNLSILPFNGRMPNSIGSRLRFTPVTNLYYWDGLGSPSFAPAPASVNMDIFDAGSFTSGQVHPTGPTTGTFAYNVSFYNTPSPTGRDHIHLISSLRIGSNADDALPNAPEGIYYFGIQLSSTLTGPNAPEASDPLYLVYKTSTITEAVHDDAIAFVNANVVPEPSTWAVLMMAGLGSAWAWKRRRSA